MITDAILGLFYTMLEAVVGVLPSGTFPVPDNSGQGFVQFIYRLDYVLPFVAPLRWFLGVAASTLVGLLAYRVALFLYNRVRG